MNSTEYDLKQRLRDSELRVDDLRTYVKKLEREVRSCEKTADKNLDKARDLSARLEQWDIFGAFSIGAVAFLSVLSLAELHARGHLLVANPNTALAGMIVAFAIGLLIGNKFGLMDLVRSFCFNTVGLDHLQWRNRGSKWLSRLYAKGDATEWREVPRG